jgi:hypothetical protein
MKSDIFAFEFPDYFLQLLTDSECPVFVEGFSEANEPKYVLCK